MAMPAKSYLAILVLASALTAPALASDATAEDDNTRAVHIIEAPAPLSTPAPLATTPMAPAPLATTPPTANSVAIPLPVPPAPSPPAPKVATPSPPPASAPLPAVPTPASVPLQYPAQRKQAALGAVPLDTKAHNSAELSVELLPGLDVAVGARVSFRVTARKPGYVVLVDVDASGKLTQIYPHPSALAGARPTRPNANYVQPGKPLQIPASGNDYSGVEYVASPPSGVAMIVAILSDRPVQILDLPDVPGPIAGQAEALAYLTKFASELRIPGASGGRLQEARWSFDAKFYAIR
jgi:Domain of unknown function (DUF4384)